MGLAMCVLSPIVGCGYGQRADRDILTAEQRALNVESFDYAWQKIHNTHWDAEKVGSEWDELRVELRPEIESAETAEKAREIMNRMIATLDQTHFGIFPADVYDDVDDDDVDDDDGVVNKDGRTGMDLRVLDDRAVVVSVEQGSHAEEFGVRPGWIVTKIGEADVDGMLKKVVERIHSDSLRPLLKARAVASRLKGRVGETVDVEFLDENDRTRTVALRLAPPRGKRVQFGHLPPHYVWFESRLLDDRIGYIRFNAFMDPMSIGRQFGEAVESFMNADGIIIDLRGNPGGIGGMSMGMAGWFVDRKDLKLGTMHLRNSELRFVIFPRAKVFEKPVTLLVDGLTGSTAEILSGGMQDIGRATVIGSRTAGAALPSIIERLPNGDGFQYAIANYISAGGEALEANGVIPAIEVIPTRAELLAGSDPALDRAVAWIAEHKSSPGASTLTD